MRYDPAHGWSTLPRAPLRERGEFAWAWTAEQLVVWGGEAAPDAEYLGDGAVFGPTQAFGAPLRAAEGLQR